MYKDAQQIIKSVCDDYGITPKRLLGTDRNKTIVLARHKAIRMIKIECGMSLSEIGEVFRRDPSWVGRVLRAK